MTPYPMERKFHDAIEKRISRFEDVLDKVDLTDQQRIAAQASWIDCIRMMEILTDRHHKRHNIVTFIIITGTAALPGLILVNNSTFRAVATAVSVITGIATALNQAYKYDARWKHFRKVSEQLKIEGESYLALSDTYADKPNHQDAFPQFIKSLTLIKQNQVTKYMEVVKENTPPKPEVVSAVRE